MDEQLRRIEVPAYQARTVRVRAGADVRIIDVEGAQVGDLWALDDAGTDVGAARWLSVPHLRDVFERLVPRPGDRLVDQTGEPILELVADDSPGRHDLLFPPCDRWLFERAGLPGHPNCRDNFLAAAGDVTVLLSACSVDHTQTNGDRCTGLAIEVGPPS